MTRGQRLATATLIATTLAIPAEGLRQWAYRDPVGILTVCYGDTSEVEPGRRYTLAECRQRLDADMLAAVEQVEACAPGLPPPVLAAFADAVYNIGPTIACDPARSTAARFLKQGLLVAACQQLPRWDKASVGGVMVSLPGLTRRRQYEMDVCLSGVSE